MRRSRSVLCVCVAAAVLQSTAVAAWMDTAKAKLGVGDIRPLDAMTTTAALPDLYNLLAMADAGQFRQHSGAIRGALVLQIRSIDGHAEFIAQHIDQLTSQAATEAPREAAMEVLASVATPSARQQLQRFASDFRIPPVAYGAKVNVGIPNSQFAQAALARLAPPRATTTAPPTHASPATIQAIEANQALAPALPNPSAVLPSHPDSLGHAPETLSSPRVAVTPPAAALAETSNQEQVPIWLGLASLCTVASLTLPFMWRPRRATALP